MIITNNIERTKYYIVNAELICKGLTDFIPEDATLVEPFVGKGDLLSLFPENKWELYDIEPQIPNTFQQDTLRKPPDYKGKWVITNPPFLAKNKATDKTIFNMYEGYDDLYKIFIHTILDAEGGIIIVPTNFLADERSKAIRFQFFEKFEIMKVNFFIKPVFPTTTYTVCSIVFKKRFTGLESGYEQFYGFFPTEEDDEYDIQDSAYITLEKSYGYRLFGNVFNYFRGPNYFSRYCGQSESMYLTNIIVDTIDTKRSIIGARWDFDGYVGKQSDRAYCRLICDKELTERQQKWLIDCFNLYIEHIRLTTHDLILTNYRDWNRKRIGFDTVYLIMSALLEEGEKEGWKTAD